MSTMTHANDLASEYPLSDAQIAQFREQGFIKLKNVFSQAALDHYGKVITDCVKARNDLADVPMDQRDTYQKAFLQVMNLWREDETVREFVFGKRLARIAAELLEVSGVRLYHDQALYKEPGGGFTPWHADQQYWPLAGEKTVTAWIPLQPVSLEMGPLAFSPASQNLNTGRNLEISDDSEKRIDQMLSDSKYGYEESPFDLGEVSFHYGWTYHRAGPNTSDQARKVMTIIYMDKQMRLKQPENPNQQSDWKNWCPGAEIGKIIDTALNPVIWANARERS